MENLEKEIRKGIEKIYQNPARIKKPKEKRGKLFKYLEKIKKKKGKQPGFEDRPITI